MKQELQKRPGQKELIDKRNLIITIDGLTGSGKWDLAKHLADNYDLLFLNTGLSIRALALLAIENKLVKTDQTSAIDIPADFPKKIVDMYEAMPEKLTIQPPIAGSRDIRFMIGDRNMLVALDAYEKRKAIENLSSIIAATPEIREKLYVEWQRAAQEFGGLVVVGRKTGDDLFPEAQMKIFLHADPAISASHRVHRHIMANELITAETNYVRRRNSMDSASGLLNPPAGAWVIDSSKYLDSKSGMRELGELVVSHFDARYTVRP